MPRYKAARFRTGAAEPESDTKYEIEAREPMETNVTDMDVDTERNTGADCNTTELDGDSPEPQMDVKVLDDNLTKSDGRFNGGLNSSKSGQHFEVGYTLPWKFSCMLHRILGLPSDSVHFTPTSCLVTGKPATDGVSGVDTMRPVCALILSFATSPTRKHIGWTKFRVARCLGYTDVEAAARELPGSELTEFLKSAITSEWLVNPSGTKSRGKSTAEEEGIESAIDATTRQERAPSDELVAFVKARDGHLWELETWNKTPTMRAYLHKDEDLLSPRGLKYGLFAYLERMRGKREYATFSLIRASKRD